MHIYNVRAFICTVIKCRQVLSIQSLSVERSCRFLFTWYTLKHSLYVSWVSIWMWMCVCYAHFPLLLLLFILLRALLLYLFQNLNQPIPFSMLMNIIIIKFNSICHSISYTHLRSLSHSLYERKEIEVHSQLIWPYLKCNILRCTNWHIEKCCIINEMRIE